MTSRKKNQNKKKNLWGYQTVKEKVIEYKKKIPRNSLRSEVFALGIELLVVTLEVKGLVVEVSQSLFKNLYGI